MLWYSLEAPQWGTSNEYTQHMFLCRNKKNYPRIITRYSLTIPVWRFIYLHCGSNTSLIFQEEKQLELALLRLFYNERDIDEITEEINRKNHQLEKENRKKEKIEDEIKDKKKEQGKLARELTKVESKIKESVGNFCKLFLQKNTVITFGTDMPKQTV